MSEIANKYKKIKVIILIVTLVLVILFSTLAGVSSNNKSGGGSNNIGGSNGDSSYYVSGTLQLNSAKSVRLSGSDYLYFSFTPSSSGTYVFTSDSQYDTYAKLFDSSWRELTYNDDGGDGRNFMISHRLSSGNTYYLGVKLYDSSSSSASVKLYVSKD
ncbi:MAG: hypothetical protein OSJ74_03730 [Clostridia bacterium]|nr:hypothetical protein [Clostridia bacterium]